MDSVKITITRGCDENGVGGTVADEPTAVLGNLPDGTPLLDVIILAFAELYPIAMVAGENPEDPQVPSMTPTRNLSYQLRLFINNVVDGWRADKKRKETAETQAAENVQIQSSYTVI